MKKRIKYQGMLMTFSVIFAVINWKYFFPNWHGEPIEEYLDGAGFCILFLGFLLRMISRSQKRRESDNSGLLVTSGIYALVRNPMYTGTFLVGAGVILVLFHWWLLPLYVALYSTIYWPQVRKEEKWLTAHFPDSYPEYKRLTPSCIPHLKKLFSKDTLVLLSFKPEWLQGELKSFAIAIPLIAAIEIFQDTYLFGYHKLGMELLEITGALLIPTALITAVWFVSRIKVTPSH